MLLLALIACQEPGPAVSGVEELGPIEQSDTIQGRDGGLSALAWGRSVWVYGDTVLNVDDVYGVNWHHNSYSITEDGDASDNLTGFTEPTDDAGAPLHLIEPSDQEQNFNLNHWGEDCAVEPCGARWAVWPGAPVWDEARQRALVFYGLIYAEPGDFNFESVGGSVAVWDDPEERPRRPVIEFDAEHPDLLWGEGAPAWGVAAVIQGDTLYTFACDGVDGGHGCALARVDLSDIHERRAWEYLGRRGWSEEDDKLEVLFEGTPIMTVSYSDHLAAWLAVYSAPFSQDVVARTAPSLEGPWSKEGVLFTADGEAPYDAVHHPEYQRDGGREQFITHSRPTDGWFGTDFPLYRVTFK